MFDGIRNKAAEIKGSIGNRIENSPRLNAAANISKQFAVGIRDTTDFKAQDMIMHSLMGMNPLLAAISGGIAEQSSQVSDNLKTLIVGGKKQLDLLETQNEKLGEISSFSEKTTDSLDSLESALSDAPEKTADAIAEKLSDDGGGLKLSNKSIKEISTPMDKSTKEVSKLNKNVIKVVKAQLAHTKMTRGTLLKIAGTIATLGSLFRTYTFMKDKGYIDKAKTYVSDKKESLQSKSEKIKETVSSNETIKNKITEPLSKKVDAEKLKNATIGIKDSTSEFISDKYNKVKDNLNPNELTSKVTDFFTSNEKLNALKSKVTSVYETSYLSILEFGNVVKDKTSKLTNKIKGMSEEAYLNFLLFKDTDKYKNIKNNVNGKVEKLKETVVGKKITGVVENIKNNETVKHAASTSRDKIETGYLYGLETKDTLKNNIKDKVKNVIPNNESVKETYNDIKDNKIFKSVENKTKDLLNKAKDQASELTKDKEKAVSFISSTLSMLSHTTLGGITGIGSSLYRGDYKNAAKSSLYFTPVAPIVSLYDMTGVAKDAYSKIKNKNMEEAAEISRNEKETKSKINETKDKIFDSFKSIKDKVFGVTKNTNETTENLHKLVENQSKSIFEMFGEVKGVKDFTRISVQKALESMSKNKKGWQKSKTLQGYVANMVADTLMAVSPTAMIGEGIAQRSISKILFGLIGKKSPLLYHTLTMPFLLFKGMVKTALASPAILRKLLFGSMKAIGGMITTVSTLLRVGFKTAMLVPKTALFIGKTATKLVTGIATGIVNTITGLFDPSKRKEMAKGFKAKFLGAISNTFSFLTSTVASLYHDFKLTKFAKDTKEALTDTIGHSVKKEYYKWRETLFGKERPYEYKSIIGKTKENISNVPGKAKDTVVSGVKNVASGVKNAATGLSGVIMPGLAETFGTFKKSPEEQAREKQTELLNEIAENTKRSVDNKKETNKKLNEEISLQKKSLKVTEKYSKEFGKYYKKWKDWVIWQKLKSFLAFGGDMIKTVLGSIGSIGTMIAGALGFKVAGKLGTKALEKLGLKSAEKAAGKVGVETAAKVATKGTAKTAETLGAKGILKAGSKVGATELAEKEGSKLLSKSLLKKLPGVGLIAGLGFGASRLLHGDWKGALGEFASGVASTFLPPGVGLAASVAIDGYLAYRDVKKEQEKVKKEQENTKKATKTLAEKINKVKKEADKPYNKSDIERPNGAKSVAEYVNSEDSVVKNHTKVLNKPIQSKTYSMESETISYSSVVDKFDYSGDKMNLAADKMNDAVEKYMKVLSDNQKEITKNISTATTNMVNTVTNITNNTTSQSDNNDNFDMKLSEMVNVRFKEYRAYTPKI